MHMDWFSTRLRVVCLVEGSGASRYMECVHVFRATDLDDAGAVALRLGRKHEQEYKNGDGALVRWRLKDVVTLDRVGLTIDDGAEIYSEFRDIEPGVQIEFDEELHPEDSTPTQCI